MSDRVALSNAHVRVLDAPASVLRRLAAARPRDYPVLLESVAQGPLGRMSLLAARPRAALWLDAAGRVGASGVVPRGASFLAALEQWWLAERTAESPDVGLELPFTGGWAVFLSYEVAAEIEPRLQLPPSELPWRALALRTPCALVHVHATGRVLAVAEADAAHELDRLACDAEEAARTVAPATPSPAQRAPLALRITEEDPAKHLERVRRAQEYI
ncbi:MAG: hypothetical protein ACRETB_03870, partial [Steroidobacteraceae bacterium]